MAVCGVALLCVAVYGLWFAPVLGGACFGMCGVYLRALWQVCVRACKPACMHRCIDPWIHTILPACLHACICMCGMRACMRVGVQSMPMRVSANPTSYLTTRQAHSAAPKKSTKRNAAFLRCTRRIERSCPGNMLKIALCMEAFTCPCTHARQYTTHA